MLAIVEAIAKFRHYLLGHKFIIKTDQKMKMTLVTLVLIVALSTKALLGAAGPAPEQVLDTSGKIVRARSSYYIVPASLI